jgi:hypothetical protein|tara:strand:- start:26676 stop:26951 length:276 start_codon:yes stop_codon:yes gene_type:complete
MQKSLTTCLLSLTILASAPVQAQSRCPADDMGCTKDNYADKVKDRVERGKREVWEADGVRDRVKAVGNTVKDCTDCATKVLTDSISKVTPE